MKVRDFPWRWLFAATILAMAISAARAEVVYSNTFETAAGAEWSSQVRDITPAGGRRFLGKFSNNAVTLSLSTLPPHTGLRISIDLFVIQYWTGNGTYYGPHLWEFGLANAPALLHTTFSNGDQPQAYPGTYPEVNNPAYTGASGINTLGYPAPGDSVYHLTFDIYHSDANAIFRFAGSHLQGLPAIQWGLDNVTVETVPVPEPMPSAASLVTNGDFETPIVPDRNLMTTKAPSEAIVGWKVTSGSVDLNGAYWENASGRQSLDMSGLDQAGILSQDLATLPGKTYRLSFAMAGNPGGQPVKYLEVWWGDTLVDTAVFDATGNDEQHMGWVREEYLVTTSPEATGPTRLKFVSLNADSFGPALDLVRVIPAPPGDLLVNGDFEYPRLLTGRTTLSINEAIWEWFVASGSVQHVGTDWQAAGGTQSLHLNGTEAGAIEYGVPTEAGKTYLLRFAMAGDPEGDPGVKRMEVAWNNVVVATPEFDTSGKSAAAMGWIEMAVLVSAPAGGSTSLRFRSLTPGSHGPALDSVSVARAVAGDPDMDGSVTVSDAMLALHIITGRQRAAADTFALSDMAPWVGLGGRLHGDGTLDTADVRVLLRLAGGLTL